jgi:hypothetical protein
VAFWGTIGIAWLLANGGATPYPEMRAGSEEEVLASFGEAFSALVSNVGPLMIGGGITFLAWVRWKVVTFRLLASSLAFAGAAGLTVSPKTSRVIGIHLGGWTAVVAVLIVAAIGAAFAFGFLAVSALPQIDNIENIDPAWLFAGGLLFYLTFFLGRGALRLVFVTYPLIRHVGDTLQVRGAAEVNAVRRGESSHMHDADGFANLFDMGSGI